MLLFSPQLQFSQRTIAPGKIDQKILSISLNLVRLFIQSGLIIIHTVSCFDRLTQIPHKTFWSPIKSKSVLAMQFIPYSPANDPAAHNRNN